MVSCESSELGASPRTEALRPRSSLCFLELYCERRDLLTLPMLPRRAAHTMSFVRDGPSLAVDAGNDAQLANGSLRRVFLVMRPSACYGVGVA